MYMFPVSELFSEHVPRVGIYVHYRDWGQEEKGMTEDELAGWHHRLDGRESE